MKLCRFDDNRLGVVEGDTIRDVSAALDVLPAYHYPLPKGDPLIANLAAVRARIDEIAGSAPTVALSGVRLLSPVANPSKIVAAPINYQAHIDLDLMDKEIAYKHEIAHISNAGLFLKSATSLVGAGEGVGIRFPDRRNDHEIELAVVIGSEARNVSEAAALDYVAGYAIGLDMTVRGPEDRSFRKSLDSYTVLGPWLTTRDEAPDPSNLALRLSVGDDVRQDANTNELVYPVPKLISLASAWYTLYPGDVLITGTPAGVGPVVDGDVMRCSIDGLGTMDVAVRNL